MSRLSTAYLLTCAAIGVAGGILLLGANWLSTLLFATVPMVSTVVAGLWVLPAAIAMRLLERPFAAILVGLISGLVIVPFSGYGFTSVVTNLWWAAFVELPFLLVAYRFWTRWQYVGGAVVLGIVYPVAAATSFDLWAQPAWAVAVFFAVTIGSSIAGVLLGVLLGDRLRAAGVARVARRRPHAAVHGPRGQE